MKIRQTNFIH